MDSSTFHTTVEAPMNRGHPLSTVRGPYGRAVVNAIVVLPRSRVMRSATDFASANSSRAV